MLERDFNAAREVLQTNRIKAAENGNAEQQEIVNKQELALSEIEKTTRATLEKYGVPDISPIKSLNESWDQLRFSLNTGGSLRRYIFITKRGNPNEPHPFSTIRDLDSVSDEELLKTRHFRRENLEEVRIKIAEYKTRHGIQT